ncbi:glycoside hydrolase family 95 protein [bacterium]|nr:glycoside hydrolase family 95 protein [bacterium]
MPNPCRSFTHRAAPLHWHDGFPLGNGALGVMLWGDGAPLCLTLDHADLWDLRCNTDFLDHPDYTYAGLRRLVGEGRHEEAAAIFDERFRRDNPVTPTKVHIGRAELQFGAAERYECTLDLDRALAHGALATAQATHELEAFVHRERSVLCLKLTDAPPEAVLTVRPLSSLSPEMAELGYPDPCFADHGDARVMMQAIPEGSACAVAWAGRGDAHFLAVAVADTADTAAAQALASLREALAVGYDALRAEHVAGWQAFWSVSTVALPEPRMEFLWAYGLYLLASSARRGHLPPGLQGVWAPDGQPSPWRGDYHADMNVQETFWPAGATGHLELLDPWCDFMQDILPAVQAHTRRIFGTEGSFYLCSMHPRYVPTAGWYTVQYAWSNTGWLAWLVWLRWRYSLDAEWLRATGYPLVAECFRFYRANLEEGPDGRLHVPLSTSPEFKENSPAAWGPDPNIDLALIRRTCDWLIEMEQALGISDLTPDARRIHGALPPYALGKPEVPLASGFAAEKILALWPGQLLTESHRHPSHLMAIHPAMDLTIEGNDEERQIIADSLTHFLELGQYRWAGHTYAQWISLAACIGRRGMAYDALRQFADRWIGPNGLHFNRDFQRTGATMFTGDPASAPFTMESNNAVTMGICDMLLQGWNDRLRVFPAVPDQWPDVAFRNLVAEGAWQVSAVRLGGLTQWVLVRAGADRLLRLKDPFDGAEVEMAGARLERDGENCVGHLAAGQGVLLRRRGRKVHYAAAAARVRQGDLSPLGLR